MDDRGRCYDGSGYIQVSMDLHADRSRSLRAALILRSHPRRCWTSLCGAPYPHEGELEWNPHQLLASRMGRRRPSAQRWPQPFGIVSRPPGASPPIYGKPSAEGTTATCPSATHRPASRAGCCPCRGRTRLPRRSTSTPLSIAPSISRWPPCR